MNVSLGKNVFGVLVSSALLTCYGLSVLFSASQPFGPHVHLFSKQLVWLCVALLSFLLMAFIRLEKLGNYAWPLCGITLFVLLLVLVPSIGVFVNGTRRWLAVGPIRLQPSEPAKIGFVLFFSHYLSTYVRDLSRLWQGFFLPMGFVGLFSLLVLVEPDFGTAFLFGSVGLFLLFLRGAHLRFFLPAFLAAGSLFALAIYLNPIRLRRITSFLDVEANRLTGAYQLWQSLIGFGSGGLWGVGLGNGRQQHFFLPEAHTDFIFSILAEELGLFHVLVVLFLFAVIAYNGLKIIQRAPSGYLFFVGVGALSFLLFQAFLNMGVVTGLLPTKGLSLPFLSYGGSNLVTSCCFIGLLVNIARSYTQLPKTLRRGEL